MLKNTVQFVGKCVNLRNTAAGRRYVSLQLHEKPKMQAWQLHSYGDIDDLQLTAARIPVITNPDDMLIRVEAASLNPIDNLMISGYGRTIIDQLRCADDVQLPLTLGRDFSGQVVAKGLNVGDDFHLGDSVYGVIPLHRQGSHAEFAIASKYLTKRKPNMLSPVEASSILYASMTAWSALWITGGLCVNPARKVLILGASGGVGTLATQMLRAKDVSVIGTCSSDAVNLVKSLGAENVFDYNHPDFVNNVTDCGNYDVILDCAKFGHENLPKTWRYKKFVTLNSPLMINTDKYGLFGGLTASFGNLMCANLDKWSRGGKSLVGWGFFAPLSGGVTFIDDLVNAGELKPTIHKVFKFSDAKSAYDCLNGGHLRGKIVLEMD